MTPGETCRRYMVVDVLRMCPPFLSTLVSGGTHFVRPAGNSIIVGLPNRSIKFETVQYGSIRF